MLSPTRNERSRDLDAVLILGLLWLASTARVLWALAHREVFGTELTLALAVAVLLPAAGTVARRRARAARRR